MKVSFEGMGEQVMTFEAAAGVTAGGLVKVSANGQVSPCANGDIPAGVALDVRDGFAAVQTAGYVEAPCASALTVGWKALGVDSAGKLAVTSGGRGALVVAVNSGVAGVIL